MAMIAKRNDIRPSLIWRLSHSTTPDQAFCASTKMLRECCPWSTGRAQESCGPRPPGEEGRGRGWGSLILSSGPLGGLAEPSARMREQQIDASRLGGQVVLQH